MEEVVGEIFLDQIALVAAANHKLMHAVGGVEFHDVPEDRPATDLDHWLWLDGRFLGEPRAESSGQNDSFHRATTS